MIHPLLHHSCLSFPWSNVGRMKGDTAFSGSNSKGWTSFISALISLYVSTSLPITTAAVILLSSWSTFNLLCWLIFIMSLQLPKSLHISPCRAQRVCFPCWQGGKESQQVSVQLSSWQNDTAGIWFHINYVRALIALATQIPYNTIPIIQFNVNITTQMRSSLGKKKNQDDDILAKTKIFVCVFEGQKWLLRPNNWIETWPGFLLIK